LILLGVALLLVGGVVIALPDSDDRLFSISETHGPSLVDAGGIAVVAIGWVLLLREIAGGIDARSRGFVLGVLLFGVGALLLAVAVVLDLGWWWLVGAAVMAAVQAVALGVARRAAKSA
jgi:hypothetical protein